jgi:predicted ABC-type ATPase
MVSDRPEIVIIAGPNGAGKTTFAKKYLAQLQQPMPFVNADLIAAGIAPLSPDSAALLAGRLMIEEMDRLVQQRKSFAFETTLAGIGYAKKLSAWSDLGYSVSLLFLRLPDVTHALDRVCARVVQGGHDIPEAVIRRRFAAGWRNFEGIYKDIADAWYVLDANNPSVILLSGERSEHG